jgi:hypothetical protein
MSIMQVIPRQSGRLAVLMLDGRTIYEQVVDPDDYRGERLHWTPVDTSSLPKDLGIAAVVDRQDQKLVVLLTDNSLWAQARDPSEMSFVKYHWVPISLAGLPAPPPAPKPKPSLKVVPKELH